MKNVYKALTIFVISLSLISCSSYRNKFGGYKKNQHTGSAENKPVISIKSKNNKPKDSRYSIPNIPNKNKQYQNVDSLSYPSGY